MVVVGSELEVLDEHFEYVLFAIDVVCLALDPAVDPHEARLFRVTVRVDDYRLILTQRIAPDVVAELSGKIEQICCLDLVWVICSGLLDGILLGLQCSTCHQF